LHKICLENFDIPVARWLVASTLQPVISGVVV